MFTPTGFYQMMKGSWQFRYSALHTLRQDWGPDMMRDGILESSNQVSSVLFMLAFLIVFIGDPL